MDPQVGAATGADLETYQSRAIQDVLCHLWFSACTYMPGLAKRDALLCTTCIWL